MSHKSGFTILELMIVVAIIAIIAAIALPGLANARRSSNEASAISSMRAIVTVNEQYHTRFQRYAGSFANLESADYIDSILGSGQKSGYDFFYGGGFDIWVCISNPIQAGETGFRYFFSNQTGVIRFSTTGPADAASDPLP